MFEFCQPILHYMEDPLLGLRRPACPPACRTPCRSVGSLVSGSERTKEQNSCKWTDTEYLEVSRRRDGVYGI
ncbi:hypothetical protein N7510_009184 [Penicillium lagena]|uniref:uncharacterized protein n=1 Tax=Penicillium lagena TaxID=94218 RepID=UPI00254064DF|nr:uncharacterized protein N7510_009184 [Penicillium lagena]KAJ5606403.1 hypothetical protein N7510_009184 [Penicillium lagena]